MKNNDAQDIDKAAIESEAFKIVNKIYSIIPELPDSEEWTTTTNLRLSSNMLLFHTAEAVASSVHSGELYAWSNAKKSAAGLRAMLRLMQTQEMSDVDSSIIKKLDVLIMQINICIKQAILEDKLEEKKRLASWMKQYKIWKETII